MYSSILPSFFEIDLNTPQEDKYLSYLINSAAEKNWGGEEVFPPIPQIRLEFIAKVLGPVVNQEPISKTEWVAFQMTHNEGLASFYLNGGFQGLSRRTTGYLMFYQALIAALGVRYDLKNNLVPADYLGSSGSSKDLHHRYFANILRESDLRLGFKTWENGFWFIKNRLKASNVINGEVEEYLEGAQHAKDVFNTAQTNAEMALT